MKKIVLGIGICLLVLVAGCGITGENKIELESNNEATVSLESEENNNEQDSKEMDDKEMADEEDNSAESVSLSITSESSASYIAQKEWLKKPADSVVGTNDNVSGTMEYNAKKGEIVSLKSVIDAKTFVSGSGGRDKEVRGLFTEDIVIVSDSPISVESNQKISAKVPLKVTINGKTQTIPFSVVGTMKNNVLVAEGTGTLSLSSYGIKPFNVLNLYKVNEQIGLKFNIIAK